MGAAVMVVVVRVEDSWLLLSLALAEAPPCDSFGGCTDTKSGFTWTFAKEKVR